VEASATDVAIVAIGYPGGFEPNLRRRDYSPWPNDTYDHPTGEAENFRAYIEDELIPRVEADLGLAGEDRTLYGHSMGGLFTVWRMLEQDPTAPTFTRFAAASPALFWGGGAILDVHEEVTDLPYRAQTGFGSLEPVQLVGYTELLLERLEASEHEGLDHRHDEVDRAVHDETWEATFALALEWLHAP